MKLMQMSTRIAALVLVAGCLLMAERAGESAPAVAPPSDASTLMGDAATGKKTFTQYCSVCHGSGGTGFIGPHIAGINWTTAGLHAIVRGGVGGYGSMPAFNADAVSDQMIADIAAYLAPPTAPPQPVTATPAAPPAGTVAPTGPPAADPIHGRDVFTANCAACHGANAQGGIGPNLHGEKTRKDTAAAIAWIKNPLPPMPKLYPGLLKEKDVDDVAAYVESL